MPVHCVDGHLGREAGQELADAGLVGALGGGTQPAAKADVIDLLFVDEEGAGGGEGLEQTALTEHGQWQRATTGGNRKQLVVQYEALPEVVDEDQATYILLTSGFTPVRSRVALSTVATSSSMDAFCEGKREPGERWKCHLVSTTGYFL